jgi:hypothetical protein
LTNVNVTCLEGSNQTVTLSAFGGPENTTFVFSNQTALLSSGNMSISNLTINVPASAPAGSYAVNIASTALDGKTFNITYSLSVAVAEIQVSGRIAATSNVATSGKYSGSWPSKIEFVSKHSTYTATICGNMPFWTTHRGTYSIFLPNNQSYEVFCIVDPGYYDVPLNRIARGNLVVDEVVGASMKVDFEC